MAIVYTFSLSFLVYLKAYYLFKRLRETRSWSEGTYEAAFLKRQY